MKRQNQPGRSRNPFSSFKIQVKGEIVSQNSPRSRIQHQKINNLSVISSKKQPHRDHRQDTLYHISRKNDQSRLRSENPQGIGRSRVAASVAADINTVRLPVKIRGLKKTECIADC